MVRYDKDDPRRIYIFDLRNNEYLGFLDVDTPIGLVATPKELGRIKRSNERLRKRIQANFDKVAKDIDDGQMELDSLPILQEQNPKKALARIMNQAEDQLLIADMMEMRLPKEKKDGEIPMANGRKHITDNYYRKVRNKKVQLID